MCNMNENNNLIYQYIDSTKENNGIEIKRYQELYSLYKLSSPEKC